LSHHISLYISPIIHLGHEPPLLKVGLHASHLEIHFFMLCTFILCLVSKARPCQRKWPHLRPRTPAECDDPKSRGRIDTAPQLEQWHRPQCSVQCRLTVIGALYAKPTEVQWLLYSKLCILPTQCICVFRIVLTINSDSFPIQH
jgi:hypothetical protein